MRLPVLDIDDDVLEREWGTTVADKLRELGDDAFLVEEGKQLKNVQVKRHILSLSGSAQHTESSSHAMMGGCDSRC
jgi:shikimate kinase